MFNIRLTYESESLRSLSQLFTPANFNRVVRKNDMSVIDNRITKHLKKDTEYSRLDLFKFIYKELAKNYKSEYIYKNTLLNKLLLGTYSMKTTTVLNEFRIANSIADFILLNGEIRVYEIKTELDSLQKLEKQIKDYQKFASKIYIVTNSKFIKSLETSYKNSNIGIIEYTNNKTLKVVLEAKTDMKNLSHDVLFKVLRKNEYLGIVNDFFGSIPNVPNTLIFKKSLELIKKIEVSEFQHLVLKELKKRKPRQPDYIKSDVTPYELKHICYTLDFNKIEYEFLKEYLQQKI